MSDQDHLNGIAEIHKAEEIRSIDEIEKEFSIEELRESISWGTRKIKLRVSNDNYLFHIVNLSERKKYGAKTSEKIDENLGLCSKAALSVRENQVYLPTSEFKGKGKVTKAEREQGMSEKQISKKIHGGIKSGSISVDEESNFVHKKEIEVFNEENQRLEKTPSSLYLKNSPYEIKIDDTIDIDEAFDHDIRYRYVLFPVEDDGGASANLLETLFDLEELEPPKYLAFTFNFNAGYRPKDAFLQIIEEEENEYILMNVGNRIETKYYGMKSSIGEMIEIDEDFDFDLSI